MQDFKLIVKHFVESNNGNRNKLAKAFEVAPTTVDRWWLGLSSPHPRLQKQVMEWIMTQGGS